MPAFVSRVSTAIGLGILVTVHRDLYHQYSAMGIKKLCCFARNSASLIDKCKGPAKCYKVFFGIGIV